MGPKTLATVAEAARHASRQGLEPSFETVRRAAEWHVLLQDPESTERDRKAFERWRAAHRAHAEAYARLTSLWGRVGQVPDDSSRLALRRALIPVKRSARSRAGKVLALALLTITVTWAGSRIAPPQYWLADHRSAVGAIETMTLADDSRVSLDTYSAIDVAYGADSRKIVLHQGGILVEVARDAARPFVVRVPHGTITALGTQFTVRRQGDRVAVVVLESRVRVCADRLEAKSHCMVFEGGERGTLTAGGVEKIGTVDASTAAAWARGELVADDRPLPEVLDTLARYRRGPILYDRGALSAVRVSGVLPATDTDRALAALAGSLPVNVRRYGPWVVVVERRPRTEASRR